MFKAIATCTCSTCGATFERRNTFSSRKDADDWKDWQESHPGECPDCCWKRKSEEKAKEEAKAAAEIIKKYHLPEITGVSEKQIKYASDLRSKELLSKEPEIIAAYASWEKVHADPNHPERWKLQKIADKKTDGDVEAIYNWFLRKYRCEKLNAIWHTSSARKIIDELLKD